MDYTPYIEFAKEKLKTAMEEHNILSYEDDFIKVSYRKATTKKITCFMYFFKLSPCIFVLKKTLKYSKVFEKIQYKIIFLRIVELFLLPLIRISFFPSF